MNDEQTTAVGSADEKAESAGAEQPETGAACG